MTLYHVETFATDTKGNKHVRTYLAHQFIIEAENLYAVRAKMARHMCPNVEADIYVPSKHKGHTTLVRLAGRMTLDRKLEMWRWTGVDVNGNTTSKGIVEPNGSIRKG